MKLTYNKKTNFIGIELHRLVYDKLQQIVSLLTDNNLSIFAELIDNKVVYKFSANSKNFISQLKDLNTNDITSIIILDGVVDKYEDELNLLKSKKVRFFASISLIEDQINILIDNSRYKEIMPELKFVLNSK